jgi:predicted Zn-dependent protease
MKFILLFILLVSLPDCSDSKLKPDSNFNPKPIDVYIVPLEDFPENLASDIAKKMSVDLNLHVKSTLRMGSLALTKQPNSEQLNSEEIIDNSQPVIKRLPELTDKTYSVLLTTNDINSPPFNFRFVFAAHNKNAHTSVVSLTRMMSYVNEKPVFDNEAQARLYKMIKRSIGEHYLGWNRSTNIKDIMYSPIMSVQDLDDVGLEHIE